MHGRGSCFIVDFGPIDIAHRIHSLIDSIQFPKRNEVFAQIMSSMILFLSNRVGAALVITILFNRSDIKYFFVQKKKLFLE